ncbi:phospholipase C/P1 nuclease domain-containing protein [Aspergillus insuetus]
MRSPILYLNFLLLSVYQPVASWGDVGHRTVAYLAERFLTDPGAQLVTELLANNRGSDISDASVWADTVKQKRPYTRPWHYIDAEDRPPTTCSVHYEDDCDDSGCIVSAMENMTYQLTDPNTGIVEQKEALMYLMHFFGDLHQPLHVEATRRGGNDIPVCFDRRCSGQNLHSVWDTAIPHKINGITHNLKHNDERKASAEWAERLYRTTGEPPLLAQECSNIQSPLVCIIQWAKETNSLICKFVLKNGVSGVEGHNLGDKYYKQAVPIVEDQIARAAMRLAVWINTIAAERPSSTEPLLVQNDL